jgi:heme/copper-type cytochrome/quinol oxidase subunit 3
MKIDKFMIVLVVIAALLFIIPAFLGLDLWEFCEEYIHPDSGLYLNLFFMVTGVFSLGYAITKTVRAFNNTKDDLTGK